MSEVTRSTRSAIQHQLDMLEMAAFNEGFEAAINGIDELSNVLHNNNETDQAETLRWLVKELKGENC